MKCLVFSDSHGSSVLMKKALSLHRDAEVVFFLGDGLYEAGLVGAQDTLRTWLYVKGNCDSSYDLPELELKKVDRINLMGNNIVFTHGDLFDAKFGYGGLCRLAKEQKADIVLYGHTHTPALKYFGDGERPFYLFNPGSISVSSGTYGILTLEKAPFFSHGTLI